MAFERGMRRRWRLLFSILVVISLVLASAEPAALHAQDVPLDRRVRSKVAPIYPDLARRMGLTGTVKLQVVIAPNGTLKDTKVIGGHPILVNAALDAVKKWKFETSTSDSAGTLEFKFEPGT